MESSKTIEDVSEIISGRGTLAIFDKIYSDVLIYNYSLGSEFMSEMWSRYKFLSVAKYFDSRIFQALVLVLFYREKLTPIYSKATLWQMPNNYLDAVLYSNEFGPVVLSATVKLRGRYKQADLEGMMLRHVHRAAKSYLITLDTKEAKTVNNKIKNDLALGLDEVVVATESAFDALIESLQSLTYIDPPKVDVLTSKRVIS